MGNRFGRKKKQELAHKAFRRGYAKGRLKGREDELEKVEGRDYRTMHTIANYERLWYWAKEELTEEHKKQFFCIIGNGTMTIDEHPIYIQKLNQLNGEINKLNRKIARLTEEDFAVLDEPKRII